MTICFAYRIEGLVQNVFYRVTARREAERLGLTGFVRNESDGSVYAVVCGNPEALTEFEAWLWKGPERAIVSNVFKTPIKSEPFKGFEVQE